MPEPFDVWCFHRHALSLKLIKEAGIAYLANIQYFDFLNRLTVFDTNLPQSFINHSHTNGNVEGIGLKSTGNGAVVPLKKDLGKAYQSDLGL